MTFAFPQDKGWSREFEMHHEKYYINEALGLICRYGGGGYWTLRDVGDIIYHIESFNAGGYNTEDMKEMLNILKRIKK